MSKIPDQMAVWNRKHASGEHEDLRHVPSNFALTQKSYSLQLMRIITQLSQWLGV